jgi:uncharacterized membrane protein
MTARRSSGKYQSAHVVPVVYALRTASERTWPEKFADWQTQLFGSTAFLGANTLFFGGWLLWNWGWIPGLSPFDPYPHGMLTMVVSLEAIYLSIVVLMSQSREAKMASMREEVDFQVNVHAEREISQILEKLNLIEKRLRIKEEETKIAPGLDLERLEQEIRDRLLL